MQSLLNYAFFGASYVFAACGSAPQNHISDDPTSKASLNSVRPVVHSSLGWRETVGIHLSSNTPESVEEAVKNAIDSWNQAAGTEILTFLGVPDYETAQSGLYSTLEDTTTMIYFDDKNWAGHTGKPVTTLATSVWENDPSSPGVIVRADIILNAENYRYIDGLDEKNASLSDQTLVDAESVIVHELGHLLGLDHVGVLKDRDSVMHAQTFIGYGIVNRTPSRGDEILIRSIYANAKLSE